VTFQPEHSETRGAFRVRTPTPSCRRAICLSSEVRTNATYKQTLWLESASELYRPSGHHFSAKLVPTFADRTCHVVSVTDPYGHNLGFLDRSRYFFFQVAPQLYSRGWVDPIPHPPLLRKLVGPGTEPGTSRSVAKNSDHQSTEAVANATYKICKQEHKTRPLVL
jgi:hypothetical protein